MPIQPTPRELCLERDRTCRGCGATKHLQVHHIDETGRSQSPNESLDNLILLCAVCHGSIHWNGTVHNARQHQSEMAALYAAGQTLQQIATRYGITRQRVDQLLSPTRPTKEYPNG